MATKKDRLQMIYEKDGRNTSSSDPEMMESRIFIGNMSKKVTRHHIEQLFSKYGKVLGVSLHRSYGFVQFDTRDGAHKAVKGENGNDLCGFKMDICVATERRKGGAGGAPDKGRGEEKRGGRRPRSRSPFSNRWGGRDDHLGRYDKFSPPRMRGSPLDPYRDPYGPPPGRDPYLYPPDGLFDRFPPPRDFYDYPVPPSRDYRSPPPPPFIDYPPPIGRRDRYERDPWDYPPSRHIPPAREREPLLPTPPPRREERDSFKSLPQPSSSSSSARPSCEAQVIYVNILQK
jgi:RNA recognition motif-containing protein